MATEYGKSPELDQVGQIEVRGIDYVSLKERHGHPIELFWVWMGGNINVYWIVLGAILVLLGLSFAQAVAALVVGNLAYFLVGLCSLQGPRTGTSTMATGRAAFGLNGGRIPSFFLWLTAVGFETVAMSLIVLAGLALLDHYGIHSSTFVKALVIIGATALEFVLPLFGHATLILAQRVLSYTLIPIAVAMAIYIAPKVHLGAISGKGSWAIFSLAVALVAVSGGFSWAPYGSDYSRYFPPDASQPRIFWSASLGGLIPSLLLGILGAAVASVESSASDPISGLPSVFAAWVFVPYLLIAILGLLIANTINLYTSGLSLQAIGVPVKRWQAVIIDSVVVLVLTFIVIFSGSFNKFLTELVSLIVVWSAPWVAIYVVDWALRRGRYDPVALHEKGRGAYWRQNGFGIPALIALALGMGAAVLWIDSPAFIGPISSRLGGSDLSIVLGMVVAGVTYWALAGKQIRKETESGLLRPLPDAVSIGSPATRDM
jgi:purine-cytosine permease-like protein